MTVDLYTDNISNARAHTHTHAHMELQLFEITYDSGKFDESGDKPSIKLTFSYENIFRNISTCVDEYLESSELNR